MTIGIICDGVHLHPELIKLVWSLVSDRLNVVTDGMAGLGMDAGIYQLGDFVVSVAENKATLPDGSLAGAVVSMDKALANLMRFTGCSVPEAVATATKMPAKLLGLTHKGRLAVGCDADLTLISMRCDVAMTIIGGKIVWEKKE